MHEGKQFLGSSELFIEWRRDRPFFSDSPNFPRFRFFHKWEAV